MADSRACGERRGTDAGYRRHLRAGEPACQDCLRGRREYDKQKKAARLCVRCKKYPRRLKHDTCDICGKAIQRERNRARTKARYYGAPRLRAKSTCPPATRPETEEEKARRYRLWAAYRLTPEQWDQMYEDQGGRCAIPGCRTSVPGGNGRFHVDHDHDCCPQPGKSCGKCIRGLLCARCNWLLGKVNDDIDLLEGLVSYIRKYKMIIVNDKYGL